MRSALCVAVLAAISLAGCSDAGSDPAGGTGGATSGGHNAHGGQNAATHIVAPTWQLGQWWTWSSDQVDADFTFVVSGDAGADWIFDTDSPEIAFLDARFDVSFLGPVRKADLAGSQGAQRVEYLKFPLVQHKNWTTTWDNEPIAIQITSVVDGKAMLVAKRDNGTLFASYSYEDKLGYFRDYESYSTDGVTVNFAAKVTSSGLDFSRDLVRWTLETKFETHGAFGQVAENFQVDVSVTDVWTELRVACTQGAFSVTFGPTAGAPQNRGFAVNGPCPTNLDQTATISPPQEPNEAWGVLAGGASDGATLDLTIIARTQTLFKHRAAPS